MKHLTTKQQLQLEQIWKDMWHKERRPDSESLTEIWYNAVLRFQSYQGDEVFESEFRTKEASLIGTPQARDYYMKLLDVVDRPAHLNEIDGFILFLTATPEEREEAYRRVMEGE